MAYTQIKVGDSPNLQYKQYTCDSVHDLGAIPNPIEGSIAFVAERGRAVKYIYIGTKWVKQVLITGQSGGDSGGSGSDTPTPSVGGGSIIVEDYSELPASAPDGTIGICKENYIKSTTETVQQEFKHFTELKNVTLGEEKTTLVLDPEIMSPLSVLDGCEWYFVPKEVLQMGITEDPSTWVEKDVYTFSFYGSLSLSTNSFTLKFIDNTDKKCVRIKFDTDQVTDITYQYDIDEDFKNPTESYSTVKQYISEVFSDFIVINTIPMFAMQEGDTDQELINQYIILTDAAANHVFSQIFELGEIEVTTVSDVKFSGIYCAENNEWIPIEEAKPNMKIYQTYDALPEYAPEGSVAYVTTNTEVNKEISQVNQLPFKMKFKENFAEIIENTNTDHLTPYNYQYDRNNMASSENTKKSYHLQTEEVYCINVFNINQIKVFQLDNEGGYTYLSGLTNENKDQLRLYFDKDNLNKELPSEDGWYNTNSKNMDSLDGAADTEEINILNRFQFVQLDNDREVFIDLKDYFSFINKYFDCKVSDCTQGLYYYQNRKWKAFTLNNIKDLTIWNNNLYYKGNSTSFDIGNPLRSFIEDWYQLGLKYDYHDQYLQWDDGGLLTLSDLKTLRTYYIYEYQHSYAWPNYFNYYSENSSTIRKTVSDNSEEYITYYIDGEDFSTSGELIWLIKMQGGSDSSKGLIKGIPYYFYDLSNVDGITNENRKYLYSENCYEATDINGNIYKYIGNCYLYPNHANNVSDSNCNFCIVEDSTETITLYVREGNEIANCTHVYYEILKYNPYPAEKLTNAMPEIVRFEGPGTSNQHFTIQANQYNIFGSPTSPMEYLKIYFDGTNPNADKFHTNFLSTYYIDFYSGSTPTSFNIEQSWGNMHGYKYHDETGEFQYTTPLVIEANRHYQITIKNNIVDWIAAPYTTPSQS